MKQPSDDTGTIARSAGTVGFAVMCSRVLGLVREQVFAGFFGAGYAYDAFVVAFRIPNLLRDLFGEGALSAAFVTVFADYDSTRGEEETWRLVNNVLAFFAVFLSLLTLVGIYFSEDIVWLLIDDDKFGAVAGKVALTQMLTIIMFPFLILVSLSAVVMGALNSKGKFFVPAMASSFFNLGSIVGGLGFYYLFKRLGYPMIAGMAVGTLIGGSLQLFCQLPLFKKIGFSFRPFIDLKDPGLRRILRLMLPAIVGLSATQLNIFINTRFASSCAEGSVSWIQYAFRLVQLPIGVFGVALSMATLPVIARYAVKKDFVSLKDAFTSSLTMGFCLSIPAGVGLWILAEPIVRLLFEHGRFSAYDTLQTAEALRFFSLGLFAYAAVKIMVPVFFALDDTRFPVIGSFIAVGVNLLLVYNFIDILGHRAVALSLSGAMACNFIFLLFVLYRKIDGFSFAYVAKGLAKILLSSAFMALTVYGLAQWCSSWLVGSLPAQISSLLVCIVGGVVVYGGLLYALKLQELEMLVGKVIVKMRG
ncbi:MAG: murein biosynthesis integral membrane protein MurJ [Proteobacteria bacterium]|nr:murein biosynthesis integral membrane protein MurJ [Pseudomonadota bacterium]MBU1640209.1 murein biosynthesis integral membrane protein MurJ [Pseudomonadota bacterium]